MLIERQSLWLEIGDIWFECEKTMHKSATQAI